MSITTGRGQARTRFDLTIADKSTEQAMLRQLDDLIDKIAILTAKLDADSTAQNIVINALTAKLDADAGITDTDYAATIISALDTNYAAVTSDLISKIDLKR